MLIFMQRNFVNDPAESVKRVRATAKRRKTFPPSVAPVVIELSDDESADDDTKKVLTKLFSKFVH
jgi:hypothetical protein